uniref:Uncharacterized protein n=1 Tax=Euplotes crassus TaxID=5936 RepID=A0A7S3KP40_EUPCR
MIPAYKEEDLRLPKKFAEQVLELEIDVENNVFTIKQIQRLMALYSKAVEFYNGKSDSKYLFYQDKLQKLITQDKVLDMLNSKAKHDHQESKVEPKEEVKTDPKTKKELKEKKKNMKMNLIITNKQLKKHDVKTEIIKKHVSDQSKEDEIIQNNLSAQKDNLKKRLEERRKRMAQKNTPKEEVGQKKTNSSTPNQIPVEKREGAESEGKTNSSGTNSVGDNCSFKINFDSLQDDKFSDELMNRLMILQKGYDDNDYDNDDLFNEEAVEEEIEKILNKCDEEVEKILEEDRQQIEYLYEDIANEKFEKLAEIKGEYKYRIKMAKTEEEQQELEKERDIELQQTKNKYDQIKAHRVQELKQKHKENKEKIKIKREGIKKVTNRVRRSASRKASRLASGIVSPRIKKERSDNHPTFTNFMPIQNQAELKQDLTKTFERMQANKPMELPKGPINMNALVKPSNEEE